MAPDRLEVGQDTDLASLLKVLHCKFFYNCYKDIRSISLLIFDIMWFSVYYDYMFSIVDLFLYSCMDSYSTHLDLLLTWVSGRDGVSVGDNHRGPIIMGEITPA
jgi:hypothetical protein